MAMLDEKYQLNYQMNSGQKILLNEELIQKLNKADYSTFQKGTKIKRRYPSLYEIVFENGDTLTIFIEPVKCKILITNFQKVIPLYSFNHLKLLLKNLMDEYKNPYFFSKFFNKDIIINNVMLEERFFSFETEIEIREMNEKTYEEEMNRIFGELKNIYLDSPSAFTYEFISPNFNTYFPNINPGKLTDIFDFYYTNQRKELESKFIKFLSDKEENKEMIFPICGPHNIGKTITSLIIQKTSFINGVKSLYFNIKYFFDQSSDNVNLKINTLIKECFFFVNNEKELLDLYKEFKKIIRIQDVVEILKNKLESKEFAKNNFFLILDQFQTTYDYNLLNLFSKFKIFLLSSINDFDVKNNIIISYSEKNEIKYKLEGENKPTRVIKYTYYEKLFIFKGIFKSFERQLEEKIKSEYKENDEKQFLIKSIFINNILKKYNYIPKYFLRYINLWDTIYDLMFNENKHIFFKLLRFQMVGTIDIKKINKLKKNNYLIEKENEEIEENKEEKKEELNCKTLQACEYIEYLKYIPLKYINYHIDENNKLYFYYSFPMFKEILEDFIDYSESNEKFFSNDGIERGISFEKILKYKFKFFKKLGIDGHLEVKSIINMDVTENYALLDKKYIERKKNILITQKIQGGKDYDFAIYMPQQHELLLIQSKYQIENKLIKHKKEYINSSQETINNFNKTFDYKIEKVYLLYISSEEYNIQRKKSVKNILGKNEINCLFYSVSHDSFSFDFENEIKNLECDDSFMMLPCLKDYKPQKFKQEEEAKLHAKGEKRNLFLGKKIKKSYCISKIFSVFQKYCSDIKLNFSVGEFEEMYCFDDIPKHQKELDKNKYIALFCLTETDDSEIDFKKPIGLNYVTKGNKSINLEITKNKNYSSFEELIDIFPNKFYYGIGKLKYY